MDTKAVEKFVTSWYAIVGLPLPTLGTKKFTKFISGVDGMYLAAREVTKKFPSKRFYAKMKIDFVDAESAYYESDTCTIAIPFWYVSEAAIESLWPELDKTAKAVSLVNGSLIHETLHSIYTRTNPAGAFNAVKPFLSATKICEAVAFTALAKIFNIVEDLFIEKQTPTSLQAYVEAKNAILFPQEGMDKALASFIEAPGFNSFAQLLVCMKVNEFRQQNLGIIRDFVDEHAHKLDKVIPFFYVSNFFRFLNNEEDYTSDVLDMSRRAEISMALVAMFEDELAKLADGESAFSADEQSSTEEMERSTRSTKVISLDAKEDAKRVKTAKESLSKAEINSIMKAAKEASSKIARATYADASTLVKCPIIIEVEESEYEGFDEELPGSLIDASFVTQLKYLRSHNHTPSVPLTRGSSLVKTRLSRIATDGKIFAQREEQPTQAKVEVNVLVDISGSTRSYYYHENSLFASMVVAAKELFFALREINIPVGVFAHSGDDTPTLMHVCGFRTKRKEKNIEKAFEALANASRKENYDGIIYPLMKSEFSQANTTKFLVILSDGFPSGENYEGRFAYDNTREAVDDLRKSGIVVICISLGDKSVFNANSLLYSPQWTLDGTTDMGAQFKNVLLSISNV